MSHLRGGGPATAAEMDTLSTIELTAQPLQPVQGFARPHPAPQWRRDRGADGTEDER